MNIAADQVMNGRDPAILRVDPITGDGYTCSDFDSSSTVTLPMHIMTPSYMFTNS